MDFSYSEHRDTWGSFLCGAIDIGVGADGTAWKIGSQPVNGLGNEILRWDNGSWVPFYGSAVRIDVDPQGHPWVINANGNIFQYGPNPTRWISIPDKATDLGIGANGDVWKIGNRLRAYGFDISKWNGTGWDPEIGGGAVRIDVDPSGDPWVVNENGSIYRYSQTSLTWTALPGLATDIGIGAEGRVWKTGVPSSSSDQFGFVISKWNGAGWDDLAQGRAEEITVGPDGRPWVVNLFDGLYRRVPK